MVAGVAVDGERSALLGERGTTDVAAEVPELPALLGASDDTDM